MQLRKYQKINNILGWAVWAIATFVYISTAERTTSWWDCGEYIATASRLMVGHPPGAPTFQILGCIATIFTFGHPEYIAFAVNIMSALCSSFSILFLFWSITMIAGKLVRIVNSKEELSKLDYVLIFGSALVGSLAYTFSDSFWFSAVEGEVYAMSSFFTAITFWAILKWESEADQPHNLRWIVFISFLIGLAIGVHLLNLLVIPAIVFTVYYKKFKPSQDGSKKQSRRGFWYSILISLLLLAGILWGIVPYTVKLAGYFELFFVNSLGLPFNSGTIAYFVLLIGGIVYGIYYATKKKKVLLHTILLCFSFLLIGYSTFLTLVIRSNAGVPLNENEPKDALSLLSYLQREQYGSRPLLYGQYFNARPVSYKETSPRYVKDEENKNYKLIGYAIESVYKDEDCSLFPRMYSNSSGGGRPHIQYYRYWSGTKAGEGTPKPTFGENLRFMFRQQIGWMYGRYFMWNFAGRQNNIQGRGYNTDGTEDVLNGNWMSGIKFIDEMRLGPQDNLPDYLKNNPARNNFYMLPLLLGLIGLLYQYRKDKRNCFVVFLLFFMTGVAIILYINAPSTEPRERDYAYAGSFYAFAIWIGLGVMAIGKALQKWMRKKGWEKGNNTAYAGGVVTALCLLAVPTLMAVEGWDDHDRSNRTAAYDFARNSLESCPPNAILIVNGDNDTFPLWYCQEVERIRTDVRIINSALANSFWHIQPLFKQNYDSKPLKFTLSKEDYGQETNDWLVLEHRDYKQHIELKSLLELLKSNNTSVTRMLQGGEMVKCLPTSKVKITVPVEELLEKGLITEEEAARCVPEIKWDIKPNANSLYKVDLAFLDILANNIFERPICLMNPVSQNDVFPTPMMTQYEGAVYRIVPYLNDNRRALSGENGFNTDKSYDLFVNKFNWGNLQEKKTAVDPESASYASTIRYQYINLAKTLIFEGKRDSAVRVLDRSLEFFPNDKVPFEGILLYQVDAYLKAGAVDKAMDLAQEMYAEYNQRLKFYEQYTTPRQSVSVRSVKEESLSVFYNMRLILYPYENLAEARELIKNCNEILKPYESR